ncbi:MAG: OmpA family protein [Woeseiaceae bacterium]|nr:OmpA family protein [Woeseiaceae bacterium]
MAERTAASFRWLVLLAGLACTLPLFDIEPPPYIAAPATIDADHARRMQQLCDRVFDAIDTPDIDFAWDDATLRPAAQPALDRLVNFARNCRRGRILIVGHTDSMGAESYNLWLSRSRAQAIANYLVARGVAADRLLVEGRGSAEPLTTNDTRAGRARNRRIEFRWQPL